MNSHDWITILRPGNMRTIRQKGHARIDLPATSSHPPSHLPQRHAHPFQILGMALQIGVRIAASSGEAVGSSVGFAVETGGEIDDGGGVVVDAASF